MDINNINVKFESNGKILEVGKGKPYRLLSIDGIDSASYDINTSPNVLADGSKVHRKSARARPIPIEAEYVGKDKKTERDRVVRFFNLHRGGKVTINNNGITRSIFYEVEGFICPLVNMYNPLKFLVNLYCPKPYMLDEFEKNEEIITWIGGMKFPLRLPTTFAMAGRRIINIINKGDVETPVKLEIYGPAANPKIKLRETGEFIRIKKILTPDDVVKITTGFGDKRVELNGENAFNLLDLPDSTFFDLKIGDNVIEFTTEDVSDSANVKVTYKNRYIGV